MTQQQAEAVLALADALLKRGRCRSAELLLALMEAELEALEQDQLEGRL